MSQRWRAVGDTVSDLTGLKFEPQTSHSRDERTTARLTGRFWISQKYSSNSPENSAERGQNPSDDQQPVAQRHFHDDNEKVRS